MISESQIHELALRWQTTELNVAREYAQHIFLSSLYAVSDVKLAFKGGTALRILKGSPRFSEYLDFTGWGKAFHIGEELKRTIRESERTGILFSINDSYQTSGGWLAIITTSIHNWPIGIEISASLRDKEPPQTEMVLVTSDLYPSYTVKALNQDEMIREKTQAVTTRKKPRDFFDIYFILRSRLSVREMVPYKKSLVGTIKELNYKELERGVKRFLPKSHWPVLKQLPQVLKRDLEIL